MDEEEEEEEEHLPYLVWTRLSNYLAKYDNEDNETSLEDSTTDNYHTRLHHLADFTF